MPKTHMKQPNRRNWTPNEKKVAVLMRLAGTKLSVIAIRLGRGVGTVASVLSAAGATRPKRVVHKRGQLTRRVRALWRHGWSDVEIAERCGVTAPAVFRVRKKLGLPANLNYKQSGALAGIASGVSRRGNRCQSGDDT